MGLKLIYGEGQTPLDEDEKIGLKITTITTQGELDEFEQLNIEKAVEWTIHGSLKSDKILTEKFVKDLHKRMYSDVWKRAGEFRRSKKNIGITWTQIGLELKNLLDDTRYWIENDTFSPEEIAIRFKHWKKVSGQMLKICDNEEFFLTIQSMFTTKTSCQKC